MTTTNANLANIPAELRAAPRWVRYELVPDKKHPEKKSQPRPVMKWADDVDATANMRTLDHLIAKGNFKDGFQYRLNKADGLVFIDLDDVRNADTGDVEPWAVALIHKMNSYAEVSKSGKGIHIVCKGTLDKDCNRKPVETYSGNAGKLMAMTGNLYDPDELLFTTVENRQAQLDQLLREQQGGAGPAVLDVLTESGAPTTLALVDVPESCLDGWLGQI